jgi:hypothetical protein
LFLQVIINFTPLKRGYERPVQNGVYASVHLLNAGIAILLCFAAPFQRSVSKAVELFVIAHLFQRGLPLPPGRLSRKADASSELLRLANVLVFIPPIFANYRRVEMLLGAVALTAIPIPPYFGLLLLDFRRLWMGMTAKERTDRILLQAHSRTALYRDNEQDDEPYGGVVQVGRLARFLAKWDRFYDDLEREQSIKGTHGRSHEDRAELERRDSDDELDYAAPLGSRTIESSSSDTSPESEIDYALAPIGIRSPLRATRTTRRDSHRTISGRHDPFLNPQQDPDELAHALDPLTQPNLRARTWSEAISNGYDELNRDFWNYVGHTIDLTISAYWRLFIPYALYRALWFMGSNLYGLDISHSMADWKPGQWYMPDWWKDVDVLGMLYAMNDRYRQLLAVVFKWLLRSATWVSDGTHTA